jgi:hypothetical protein
MPLCHSVAPSLLRSASALCAESPLTASVHQRRFTIENAAVWCNAC